MKQDEIAWFSKMTEEEIENSVNLPFVDKWKGGILADVGAILYLLPPAPAVVLDVGVGGGLVVVVLCEGRIHCYWD